MPQALIAVINVLVGPFGLLGGLVLNAIGIPVSTGLIGDLLGIGPRQSRPRPSDGQQNINEAIGSRTRNYGIVHTGGQRTFLDSADGRLGIVVTLGTGEETEILEHRINDKVVTVVGGTVTDASYRNAIHIYTRAGTDDQTAVGELTARFPQWTADHCQRGCALAALICDPVKQQHFSEVYNGQVPIYTQVRKAAKLYDPRKDDTAVIGADDAGEPVYGSGSHRLADRSTWEWSDNGPLVIADYFAHADGYGGGYQNVRWEVVAGEADIADELVTTRSGDTIKRWRLWASYSLAATERRQIMSDLRTAMDAFVWQDADGLFNVQCGRWVEPTITLTDDHILGMSATLGPPAQKQVSAVKVLYTEAAIGYREQESALVANPDSPDDPNAEPEPLECYYAPHHNQAVRVGKLTVARLGDRWHITALINLFGLNLLGQRTCRLVSADLGLSAYFAVAGLKFNAGDNTIEAKLDEVRPEDWDLDAATEEGEPPLAPGASAPPPALAAPTGLTLSAVQIALGETNGVSIAALWDDPGRADLSWEAQLSVDGDDDWSGMAVDQDARTARSGPVNSGAAYAVRVRAMTITGRASDWASTTITPTAAPSALGAPTDLAALGGVGEADVTFRMPTSARLAFARLYHAATSDFSTATQAGSDLVGALGEAMAVNDPGLGAGAQYYWVRAFDGSGGQSALTGPVSTTIS